MFCFCNFSYFIPSVTLVGIGASKEIPAKIKTLGGEKPLIVADKGITAAGITGQVTDMLSKAGMECVVYDDTIPNPTDTNVHEGVEVYKSNNCDSLITLGGGSAHDCGMAPRDAAELALAAIQKLSTDIGIPAGLVELGKRYGKEVKAEDIGVMTGNAQKDACGLTNPRRPTDEDVAAIYTAAL